MSKTQRRRRVATSDNVAGGSVFELYEIHGDAAAALAACPTIRIGGGTDNAGQQGNTAEDYNRVLLSYMASDSGGYSNSSKEKMVQQMEEWETMFGNKDAFPSVKARKRTRNEWIAAYNRALLLLANGDVVKSNKVCSEKLRVMVTGKKKASSEMSMVSTRMGFLFLEGTLTNSLASHSGLRDFDATLTAASVIEWLEMQTPESDPQFLFLLALYKSRVDFAERDEKGKHLDAKIRSARKELKTAMEVFQHKLRPSTPGDDSLASSLEADDVHCSAAAAKDKDAIAAGDNSNNSQPQISPMSLVLQKQNQAALNLKANVEHLKGNPKKSLILLGEALTASPDDSFYNAMHANNLALVYETNGKRHLAIHTMTKALRVDLLKPNFQSDGTARPDPSLVTLYNSALCSLQARKFLSAYECLNACVRHSPVFCRRARCWILMAEACIGIHAGNKKKSASNTFAALEVKGEAKGLLIQSTSRDIIKDSIKTDTINVDDIDAVKKKPLLRARTCLETSLHLVNEEGSKDIDALSSTRLALSYILLELRDFVRALKMANLVIEGDKSSSSMAQKSRAELRKIATARMYASEASCALGQAQDGMRYLVGDGQDDAFDRLAMELGGVTMQVAASNMKGKARLARAQSMVRSSASAASAVLGNIGPAKQLAMSAQAMENASSSKGESTARRALIYCMLREGNNGAALSLLKSLS